MFRLVIDLSKPKNDPDRRKMVELSSKELADREQIQLELQAANDDIRAKKDKRKDTIDKISKKLNMDLEELTELFGE